MGGYRNDLHISMRKDGRPGGGRESSHISRVASYSHSADRWIIVRRRSPPSHGPDRSRRGRRPPPVITSSSRSRPRPSSGLPRSDRLTMAILVPARARNQPRAGLGRSTRRFASHVAHQGAVEGSTGRCGCAYGRNRQSVNPRRVTNCTYLAQQNIFAGQMVRLFRVG